MNELCMTTTNIMKENYPDVWDYVLDILMNGKLGDQVQEAIKGHSDLKGIQFTSFHTKGVNWEDGLVQVYAL